MVLALDGPILLTDPEGFDPAQGSVDLLVDPSLGLAREDHLGGPVGTAVGRHVGPGAAGGGEALRLTAEAQETVEGEPRLVALHAHHAPIAEIVQ
jgi:hypothetical protein